MRVLFRSRSKKQPENRGRKRHAKFFGGGAAGHRGGRVQRARADANHRSTAKGSECAVLDPGSTRRRFTHAGDGSEGRRQLDRKSVASGTNVSVSVAFGGGRIIKKKK